MSLFFSFLLLPLSKFRKCPWSTSSDSLLLPACILAMLTPCLLLGLCSYCFFHLKHPSLLFIPILYASAQQALILTSLPLDWTRCSFSGKLGDYTFGSLPACQDWSMARPDPMPPVKCCILSSRSVQFIVAE